MPKKYVNGVLKDATKKDIENIEKYQKQDEEKAKLIKEQNDVIELKRSSAKTKLLDLGLTEEEMLNAVKFGHEGFVPIINTINELAAECKKPDWIVEKKDLSEITKKLEEEFTDQLKEAFSTIDKQERSNKISEITDKAKKIFEENENYTDLDVNSELKNL